VLVVSSGAPYVVIEITSPGIIVTSLYWAFSADTGEDDPAVDPLIAGPANCPAAAAAPKITPQLTPTIALIPPIDRRFIPLLPRASATPRDLLSIFVRVIPKVAVVLGQ
jgi:hypothetical protein